jgi:arginyl-tRNA synthetase
VVEEKNPELPQEQKDKIAQAVGIGAVKYSDYSNNRDSDYIFSFDKMLAMDGNTAPYMQYAYARIRSIERKAEQNGIDIRKEMTGICEISLSDPAEQALAKQLLQYSQAILGAAADCRPNYLTAYLYELSQSFSRFYNACPVVTSEGQTRTVRFLLCDVTARTIQHGMTQLLGIEVPQQM